MIKFEKKISEAALCNFNQSCLTTDRCGEYLLCNVEYKPTTTDILFVEHSGCNCNYRLAFGNKTICNCPLRNEIYKRENR